MASDQVVKVRKEELTACFTCPLCNKLFRNATTVPECLHTFCRRCIHKKISDDGLSCCPVCRVDLGAYPLDKLRPDNNWQDIRNKIFLRKNRHAKPPDDVSSTTLLSKREQRPVSLQESSALESSTFTWRERKPAARKSCAALVSSSAARKSCAPQVSSSTATDLVKEKVSCIHENIPQASGQIASSHLQIGNRRSAFEICSHDKKELAKGKEVCPSNFSMPELQIASDAKLAQQTGEESTSPRLFNSLIAKLNKKRESFPKNSSIIPETSSQIASDNYQAPKNLLAPQVSSFHYEKLIKGKQIYPNYSSISETSGGERVQTPASFILVKPKGSWGTKTKRASPSQDLDLCTPPKFVINECIRERRASLPEDNIVVPEQAVAAKATRRRRAACSEGLDRNIPDQAFASQGCGQGRAAPSGSSNINISHQAHLGQATREMRTARLESLDINSPPQDFTSQGSRQRRVALSEGLDMNIPAQAVAFQGNRQRRATQSKVIDIDIPPQVVTKEGITQARAHNFIDLTEDDSPTQDRADQFRGFDMNVAPQDGTYKTTGLSRAPQSGVLRIYKPPQIHGTKQMAACSKEFDLNVSPQPITAKRIGQRESANSEGININIPLQADSYADSEGTGRSNPMWFCLLACENQSGCTQLPQIPSCYLRVKDRSFRVSFIKKYLAKKLNLASEHEVEIRFQGLPLDPTEKLEDLVYLWGQTILPESLCMEEPISGSSAENYVTVLSYSRKAAPHQWMASSSNSRQF